MSAKQSERAVKAPPTLSPRPVGASIIAGMQLPRAGTDYSATNQNSGERMLPDVTVPGRHEADEAATAAWAAFNRARDFPAARHAELLDRLAVNLDTLGEALVLQSAAETGIPQERLRGELARTIGTVRMFAGVVREGSWVEAMIDKAGGSGRHGASHDLRRMLVPLGPVAVFTASNLPLAYGSAGTDTVSALAAGCPVVAKGHALHPGASELAAACVADAVRAADFPPGWFSFLHGGGDRDHDLGAGLVVHPCVRAAGFTGSRKGGDALARLAADRPDPIPFFAEMGSVNPVVILPGALETEPEKIGRTLAQSLALANGQQCTCPGLIFAVAGPGLEAMLRSMAAELDKVEPAPMLGPRIHMNYIRVLREVLALEGVEVIYGKDNVPPPPPPGRSMHKPPVLAAPVVLQCGAATFAEQPLLLEEIFGPAMIVVPCRGLQELATSAGSVVGSLTCSMFIGGADREVARKLVPLLEQRCGRLVFNGVPTGVEVAWSMVHGGPYPACNRPDTSAVGPTAMRRWRRPVCFQNAPAELLPPELVDGNPMGIERQIGGARTRAAC